MQSGFVYNPSRRLGGASSDWRRRPEQRQELMRAFSRAFGLLREFCGMLRQHGRLLYVMAAREITDRFAGSALGAVWALAHPLFLMALFVVVFTFIFGL